VRFSDSNAAKENDVGVFFDESQAEEVLHLKAVDFAWPVPLELLHGFDDREAGEFDAPCDGALTS